jgi:F-type H+-transporting ATPase subunit epsilon
VVSVHVPGNDGPFEVLKDHAPIVASLANPGVLHFRTLDGQAMKFNLLGGVVEVLSNKIILLSPGLQQD